MTKCEKCGKKVSFLYASKQKKREDIIFCESCMNEFNEKVKKIEEKRKNESLKGFTMSKPPELTLEQRLFRLEHGSSLLCDKCNKLYQSIYVFFYGEKKYCGNCFDVLLTESKIPHTFFITVTHHKVEGHDVVSKTFTVISLTEKDTLIWTAQTMSDNLLPQSAGMDILAQISNEIKRSKIRENLIKQKDVYEKNIVSDKGLKETRYCFHCSGKLESDNTGDICFSCWQKIIKVLKKDMNDASKSYRL